ncbi:MAG: hypothetical protein KIT79_12570 [Deltaproteobacteria bacterium]|nr:hypothetical protein [Deltaproteobacteria bacterium]
MTVIEYFRDWLNVPWLWDAGKKIHGLWETLTETLQKRQDELELARTLRFPRFSEGEALRRHGRARAIDPATGETEDHYRARVIAAHATWRSAGTDPGMVAALVLLGFPRVEILEDRSETYYDGTWVHDGMIDFGWLAWALFDVVIYLNSEDQIPDVHAWRRLLNQVRLVKPARSRPYRFLFYLYDPDGDHTYYATVFASETGHPYRYDGADYNGGQLLHGGAAEYGGVWGLPSDLWE